MSDTQVKSTERRNQTLILVEGEHEKGVLLRIILKCFPDINVGFEDIHVYCSDIYDLYHAIEKEYDEDWYESGDEINIPLLISRKENITPVLDKRKFTNIILIFDYERHDEENGIIWVLCTCLMFLGEYKFFWKQVSMII